MKTHRVCPALGLFLKRQNAWTSQQKWVNFTKKKRSVRQILLPLPPLKQYSSSKTEIMSYRMEQSALMIFKGRWVHSRSHYPSPHGPSNRESACLLERLLQRRPHVRLQDKRPSLLSQLSHWAPCQTTRPSTRYSQLCPYCSMPMPSPSMTSHNLNLEIFSTSWSQLTRDARYYWYRPIQASKLNIITFGSEHCCWYDRPKRWQSSNSDIKCWLSNFHNLPSERVHFEKQCMSASASGPSLRIGMLKCYFHYSSLQLYKKVHVSVSAKMI